MELITYLGMLVVSLAVLLKSSDWFIDSAEEIGLSLGISPFIIGVTIVAFGTSLPELATSIAAVFDNESSIVVANVVGSNITNIALVLGLVSIVVKQIDLEYDIWHIDMPFLWGSAFLLGLAIWDLDFSFFEAILFFVGIVIFLAYSFKTDESDSEEQREKASLKSYAFLLLGGVFVWLSADYTIEAIRQLSLLAGISPGVIALTVVALGTSLP
ncbi:MAG: sodium:calcium antiporter, partial [Bacteroidota bacterium]